MKGIKFALDSFKIAVRLEANKNSKKFFILFFESEFTE